MNKIATFNFSDSEIQDIKKRSIGALVLFGSQAQGLANQASDFDIGVIINDKKALYDNTKRKEIYDFLYELFSNKINKITDIDIVFLGVAPEELRFHVMKYGKIIFEFPFGVFADFKASTMEQYADFAPFRHVFQQGIFSRIQ